MHREDVLKRLGFSVPADRRVRVIVHSDIAAEADDYFAVAHHLMSPSEDVVGIIAANFEWRFRTIKHPMMQAQRLTSMEKSFAAGKELLSAMEIDDVPLLHGAKTASPKKTWSPSARDRSSSYRRRCGSRTSRCTLPCRRGSPTLPRPTSPSPRLRRRSPPPSGSGAVPIPAAGRNPTCSMTSRRPGSSLTRRFRSGRYPSTSTAV